MVPGRASRQSFSIIITMSSKRRTYYLNLLLGMAAAHVVMQVALAVDIGGIRHALVGLVLFYIAMGITGSFWWVRVRPAPIVWIMLIPVTYVLDLMLGSLEVSGPLFSIEVIAMVTIWFPIFCPVLALGVMIGHVVFKDHLAIVGGTLNAVIIDAGEDQAIER